MGGIILLVILIPIIFLILLIIVLNRLGEQRSLLESLNNQLGKLRRDVSGITSKTQQATTENIVSEPVVVAEPPIEIISEERDVQQKEKETEFVPLFVPAPILQTTEEPDAVDPKEDVTEAPHTSSQYEKEKKRNDLEKFIGENVANKIGIAVLVLGIAFFVKYAIDKNWIQESGRVITGLVSGAILIALAHYFRNKYRSFSSVLVGGGLTVFYVSIAFAFHEYHLIGQTTAFLLMVAISIFAVLLSLFYDRQELAILATIGGFITPFLVGSSQSDHVSLFTYLCILNGGLTALSWFKRWPAINSISLFFTTIIFGGWLFNWSYSNSPSAFPHQLGLVFATIFYMLFMIMNIINVIRLRDRFIAFDLVILLSINFLYYIAGTMILDLTEQTVYNGLFTFLLGAFNLLLFGIFQRTISVDRGFVALLLGVSLTFLSLSIPVQFKGEHVTMAWMAEAIILLFLYQRTKMPLLKVASLIVLGCMFFDLLIVWTRVYLNDPQLLPVLLNNGFITGSVVSTGLFIYHRMLSKEKDDDFLPGVAMTDVKRIVRIFFISLLFITGILEIYHQFNSRFNESPVYILFLQLYSFLFFCCFLWYHRRSASRLYWQIVLSALATGFYLISASATNAVSEWLLSSSNYQLLIIGHWLASIILIAMLLQLSIDLYQDFKKSGKERQPALTWLTSGALVMVLSIELYQVMLWVNPNDELNREVWQQQFYKAGLSILWSICSFLFIWMGMRFHFRTLRLIGLSLFSLTLLKLFLFDIRTMQPGGKIAAFILLGCLLLTVSFMYQRVKRMIDEGLPDKNS